MKFKVFKRIIKKYDSLKLENKKGKKVLIFMHDFPDPDCLTSACILKNIFEFFGFASRIVYGGAIIRAENKELVRSLKMKVYPYRPGEEDYFSLTALVDTNQYIRNHSFPKELVPDFTFDHHKFRNYQPLENLFERFYEINTEYGSCSSILMEYLLHFKISLDVNLATAYCYTMLAETNHFERDFSDKDVWLYRKSIQLADLKKISKILNIKKPLMYFNALKKGLISYQKVKKTILCHLGKVASVEMIHQVADFLLRMEGVNICVVTGNSGGKINKICIRSQHSKIHVGNCLKISLEPFGQGGGHKNMAAGTFSGDEKKVVKAFLKSLPN